MRVLLQRVVRAKVTVGDEIVGAIGPGMLLLVGISAIDTPDLAGQLASKCVNLRIFDDDQGVMNRSLADLRSVGDDAAVLAVSQFTLYADTRKGRRPSYVDAAPPNIALPVFELFVSTIREMQVPVQTGQFGAEMAVELVNDGPVTIWLDSDALRRGM